MATSNLQESWPVHKTRSALARVGGIRPARKLNSGSSIREQPAPGYVRAVCDRLVSSYGRPRLGNPEAALDDLVFIILSNRTSPDRARSVYAALKREFPRWETMLSTKESTLQEIIRPAGLSGTKSRQLLGILNALVNDSHACSLQWLSQLTVGDAESYLIGLPGVSHKVAKCVLMYAFDFNVLPVDVHVHRISRRLGWVTRQRADQCHADLEAIVKPSLRRDFHVGCIVLGREICRPHRPACERCCLRSLCPSAGLN